MSDDLKGMVTCASCGFDYFEHADSEGILYVFCEDDLPRCTLHCLDRYLDAKESEG